MNRIQFLRTAFAIASASLFPIMEAQANDDFSCWQPSKTTAAASAEYWTKDRRDKALSEDDANNFVGGDNDKLGDAERANIQDAPYKFGGKVFFTRGGQNFQASAQFVGDNNIVIAAAHSMFKADKQATNIAFYRGYENGGGTPFSFDQVAILAAWKPVSTDKPSFERAALDYAVLRTTTPSDAGAFTLGIGPSFTDVTIMGYPGNLENGNLMYAQTSTKDQQVGNAFEVRPNAFLHGSSGGAWFVPQDGGFAAVSTVSGGTDIHLLGPAFTSKTQELIAFVKAGCK
ncbi:hypothetical protein [Phyllobacterium myrsinacearum]|uniref:Serine protease n=1 Tax=Phyllobacterium myrsinacearum TaxID=28101 RepID=A0A839EL57_9HYPH|nr:hypothetical protein [Phyllobacterium myrsinacearum]MBA8879018.1 hypothetical protein [Phyllobacterium myrsinacearum]